MYPFENRIRAIELYIKLEKPLHQTAHLEGQPGHAAQVHEAHCNFGQNMMLWDQVFGT